MFQHKISLMDCTPSITMMVNHHENCTTTGLGSLSLLYGIMFSRVRCYYHSMLVSPQPLLPVQKLSMLKVVIICESLHLRSMDKLSPYLNEHNTSCKSNTLQILFGISFVFKSDHLYLCDLLGIWCSCLQDLNFLVNIWRVQPSCAIMSLASIHVFFPLSVTIKNQQPLNYFQNVVRAAIYQYRKRMWKVQAYKFFACGWQVFTYSEHLQLFNVFSCVQIW